MYPSPRKEGYIHCLYLTYIIEQIRESMIMAERTGEVRKHMSKESRVLPTVTPSIHKEGQILEYQGIYDHLVYIKKGKY